MNELLERVYEEAQSAWRFRWPALGLAAVLAMLGWVGVFAMPDRYEANASIFVDTSTALQPMLRDLAVQQDITAQLNYVRRSLLTGSQLQRIATDSGVLAETVTSPTEVAEILEDFAQRVVFTAASASGNARSNQAAAGSIYSFNYLDSDRDRSIKVVDTVLNAFVEETLGGKRRGSESAQKFLEEQIKSYEQRLREAENRLAEFKKANIGLMPTEGGDYFAQLQSQIDLATAAQSNLGVAMTRRAELQRQLRGESVIGAAAPASGAFVTGASDTLTRMKEAQARADELLLRYTERHPDVIAARATLAELEQRRAAEVESLRRGDAAAVASSGVSANPVYQSIQLQLNQVDVEIASLRGQLTQARSKAAELRQRLDTAPQVEAEYAQLNRDYDINKAQYTTLLANYDKARLGEEADAAGSVRFDIVQPPSADLTPVSPPRVLLLSLVLVGSLALGAGLAYLLHQMRPVVGSIRSLAELSGFPVLGAVSGAFPEQMGKQARRATAGFIGASAALAAVFVVVLLLNFSGLRLGLFG